MLIAFDTDKDASNTAKHGVSLAFGARVFADPAAITIETIRLGDEEQRYKQIGLVDGRLWTAVHTWRGRTIRFISVRRSNDGEQRSYDAARG